MSGCKRAQGKVEGMRFILRELVIEDVDRGRDAAVCGDLVSARKMLDVMNTRNIIKGITSERDCRAASVLAIVLARETEGVLG
jgi:hypothetical protein